MEIIKLDLGCGNNKQKGFIGIDKNKSDQVNIICDLEKKKLPFKDNSVDQIHTRHFLEHTNNPDKIIDEIYRVLKPKGKVIIIVPHWSWYGSYTFMHKRFFHSRDFNFYDKKHPAHYYTKSNFRFIDVKFNWGKLQGYKISTCLNSIINKILNINSFLSEEILVNFFRPKEIIVEMYKDDS
jgi:predicted SAM-dependent methyltransferase